VLYLFGVLVFIYNLAKTVQGAPAATPGAERPLAMEG
jgi:hypothetical protein